MSEPCTAHVDVERFGENGEITFKVEVSSGRRSSGTFLFEYDFAEAGAETRRGTHVARWSAAAPGDRFPLKIDLRLGKGLSLLSVHVVDASIECAFTEGEGKP